MPKMVMPSWFDTARKLPINRTDIGIKYGSKIFFENLGDKFIYEDFELVITLIPAL